MAPGGQRTLLVLSAGTLVRVTNPAGESNEFSYDGPLMVARRDPKGNSYSYTYNAAGRLVRDADPASGFISLVRSGGRNFSVTRTSAEGRTHRYDVTLRPDLKEERLSIDAAGNQTITVFGDGSWISADAGGTTTSVLQTGDPRYGADVPLGTATVRTPSGRTATMSMTRSITLADANNPLSLRSLTDITTVNGRRYTTIVNAATRKSVSTSPMGRTTTSTFDDRARIVALDTPGLASTSVQYQNGLLESVTRGARQYRFAYTARREVASVTDPLSRTTTFVYDAAGRLKTSTAADGRVTMFDYDANGNAIAITPPGRSAYRYTYTAVNLAATYTPPAVANGGEITLAYDKDRQLSVITRADGNALVIGRDAAGRPSRRRCPYRS